MNSEFFPPGMDLEQVIEERYSQFHAAAAAEFPPCLRLSPYVGYALQSTLNFLRDHPQRLDSFRSLLREQANKELASILIPVMPMARKLARRNAALARIAEEVPGAVVISLWKANSVFDPSRGQFLGWLKTFTYHVAMQLLDEEYEAIRRTGEGADPALIVDDRPVPGSEPAPVQSREKLIQLFHDALQDPLDRTIFLMAFRDEMSNESIAASLHLSMNALYKRRERIRKKLDPLRGRFFEEE